MKKFLFPLFIFLLAFPLAGCWDQVEIEDRGFVVSIGIDGLAANEGNNRYGVTMEVPNALGLESNGKGGAGEKKVKEAVSETITGGMALLDSYSGQAFYYGHTKVCVLGESVLRDAELLREAIDALARNKEMSRNMLLLAADGEAADVLSAETPDEPIVGVFASDFFQHTPAARCDLGEIERQLAAGKDTVIPKISLTAGEIRISGFAVVKDFQLAGWLVEEQAQRYTWATRENNAGLVTVAFEGTFVPLRVTVKKADIAFEEADGHLVCVLSADAEAEVLAYKASDLKLSEPQVLDKLTKRCEAQIAGEYKAMAETLQKDFGADALGLRDRLYRDFYALHEAYGTDWETAYETMTFVSYVDVRIGRTGNDAV